MWWAWPSLAFLPCSITTPRGPTLFRSVGLRGREFGLWCKHDYHDGMVIRLCHAAHHLLLSFREAWDSSGSMGMGALHTSHKPPARIRPYKTTLTAPTHASARGLSWSVRGRVRSESVSLCGLGRKTSRAWRLGSLCWQPLTPLTRGR